MDLIIVIIIYETKQLYAPRSLEPVLTLAGFCGFEPLFQSHKGFLEFQASKLGGTQGR